MRREGKRRIRERGENWRVVREVKRTGERRWVGVGGNGIIGEEENTGDGQMEDRKRHEVEFE